MTKRVLEIIAKIVARNNLLWKLTIPFQYFINHLQLYRKQLEQYAPKRSEFADRIEPLLGSPIVKNGPFAGLIYPSFFSYGSAMYPKILGSYEAELHEIFKKELLKDYDEIYDIGCAEGYYAVGLAIKKPNAIIHAYDINEQAATFCKEMAVLNEVSGQVDIQSNFYPDLFKSFNPDKKIFFICDCEGYENELFTEEISPYLKNVTVLIETHDFIIPETSTKLELLFKETHDIQMIQSVDDIIKTKTYQYKEIENIDNHLKRLILEENRPHIMEWIYATPKTFRF